MYNLPHNTFTLWYWVFLSVFSPFVYCYSVTAYQIFIPTEFNSYSAPYEFTQIFIVVTFQEASEYFESRKFKLFKLYCWTIVSLDYKQCQGLSPPILKGEMPFGLDNWFGSKNGIFKPNFWIYEQ